MRRVFVYEYFTGGGAGPDAHALRAAGGAMRDAIVDDLRRLPGVAVTVAADAGAAAGVVTSAPRTGESPAAFVRREAARHDHAWIVAPETGGVLAALHRAVGPARWIGCTAEAIATASSKQATVRALAAAGVATPLAVTDEGCGGWIVKPDDGAGSVAARRHASLAAAQADLDARRCAGQPSTLEPWVAGEALSVTLLADGRGVQPLAFNRQRIGVDADGALHDDGVDVDALRRAADPRVPHLAAWVRGVARAVPGLRGVCGVDLVWHPRRGPVAIEVNPRPTTAYVGLSARLGRNVAADVLRAHGCAAVEAAHE